MVNQWSTNGQLEGGDVRLGPLPSDRDRDRALVNHWSTNGQPVVNQRPGGAFKCKSPKSKMSSTIDGDGDSAAEPCWPECRLCAMPFKPGTGRGPGSNACSRSKCRKQLRASDKDVRIEELQARLVEKDAVIASQAALIASRAHCDSSAAAGAAGTAAPVPSAV